MRNAGMVGAGLLGLALASPGDAFGQGINMQLVANWDGYGGSYGDVWASDGYAYVAHYQDAGVHIVDIQDPASPTTAAHYRVPSPSADASAQDVKVYNGLMFVALESETSNSVDIVDVRNPNSPQHLTWIRIDELLRPHNLFYDNGYLYIVDGETPTVGLVDLNGYDPDNPPAVITTLAHYVEDVSGGSFGLVHDITVQDGRLYVCAWNSGLVVYDVSDLATQAPQRIGSAVSGQSTHSCWPTADNRFVVTAHEHGRGGIKVFEIIENGDGTITLELRDQFKIDYAEAFCAHNPLIIGHRVYTAWYQAGVVIHDIDPVTGELTFVGLYDTYPGPRVGSYEGAWGVYPFNGEDQILVSDLSTGLWVVSFEPTEPIIMVFPNGLPTAVAPRATATFQVRLIAGTEAVVTGSETLAYRIGSAGGFKQTPLTALGDGYYDATLPAQLCYGEPLEFYVSVEGSLGTTVFGPAAGPAGPFSVPVATPAVFFEDDFETDQGWTIENVDLSAGAWERGVPAGDGDRGDPPSDFDGSGGCYLTENVAGNSDVDGGPTRLISPAIDLGAGGTFSYARWFSTNEPGVDSLVVEISNDDGQSWVLVENVQQSAESWQWVTYVVADFVTPTAQVRFRFSATDNPNNSVTEAAIDAFAVSRLICIGAGDMTCDGSLDSEDIDWFFLALGNGWLYEIVMPDCDLSLADANYSGTIDAEDIDPFFACLGAGGCP